MIRYIVFSILGSFSYCFVINASLEQYMLYNLLGYFLFSLSMSFYFDKIKISRILSIMGLTIGLHEIFSIGYRYFNLFMGKMSFLYELVIPIIFVSLTVSTVLIIWDSMRSLIKGSENSNSNTFQGKPNWLIRLLPILIMFIVSIVAFRLR